MAPGGPARSFWEPQGGPGARGSGGKGVRGGQGGPGERGSGGKGVRGKGGPGERESGGKGVTWRSCKVPLVPGAVYRVVMVRRTSDAWGPSAVTDTTTTDDSGTPAAEAAADWRALIMRAEYLRYPGGPWLPRGYLRHPGGPWLPRRRREERAGRHTQTIGTTSDCRRQVLVG